MLDKKGQAIPPKSAPMSKTTRALAVSMRGKERKFLGKQKMGDSLGASSPPDGDSNYASGQRRGNLKEILDIGAGLQLSPLRGPVGSKMQVKGKDSEGQGARRQVSAEPRAHLTSGWGRDFVARAAWTAPLPLPGKCGAGRYAGAMGVARRDSCSSAEQHL